MKPLLAFEWSAVASTLGGLGSFLTSQIAVVFLWAHDRAVAGVTYLADKAIGSSSLGFGAKPEGAGEPGAWGVPVDSDSWAPWMHLGVPEMVRTYLDVWFPFREAIGAFGIIFLWWSTVWLVKTLIRAMPGF